MSLEEALTAVEQHIEQVSGPCFPWMPLRWRPPALRCDDSRSFTWVLEQSKGISAAQLPLSLNNGWPPLASNWPMQRDNLARVSRDHRPASRRGGSPGGQQPSRPPTATPRPARARRARWRESTVRQAEFLARRCLYFAGVGIPSPATCSCGARRANFSGIVCYKNNSPALAYQALKYFNANPAGGVSGCAFWRAGVRWTGCAVGTRAIRSRRARRQFP